jgi:hypothetical protein
MLDVRSQKISPDLVSLEAAAASARSGFACIFSTSDEYEAALIDVRRAEGRYSTRLDWQPVLLASCIVLLSAALLAMNI